MSETRIMTVAYLRAVKAHLETHIGPRRKYDDEVSRLLDQTTVAIEDERKDT